MDFLLGLFWTIVVTALLLSLFQLIGATMQWMATGRKPWEPDDPDS